MKKGLLLLPILMISLTSCEKAQRLNDLISQSSYAIDENRAAVEKSTQVIEENQRYIEAANAAIEANRNHLIELSEK